MWGNICFFSSLPNGRRFRIWCPEPASTGISGRTVTIKAVCIRRPECFFRRDSVSPLGARRKRLAGFLKHDKLYRPYPHTVVRKSETPGTSAPHRLAERSCGSKAAAGARHHPVPPTADPEGSWRCIFIETRLPNVAVYRRRRDRIDGQRATTVTFCSARSSFTKNRENLLTLNPK